MCTIACVHFRHLHLVDVPFMPTVTIDRYTGRDKSRALQTLKNTDDTSCLFTNKRPPQMSQFSHCQNATDVTTPKGAGHHP